MKGIRNGVLVISSEKRNHVSEGSMRRYHQLLLIIVAIASLVSFLFYKHEYDRLRKVLEVLDIFGKGPASSEDPLCPILKKRVGDDNSLGQFTPMPAWQVVGEGVSIYSAFWEDKEPDIKRVKVIGVGKKNAHIKLGCHVWYEDSETPVSGAFSLEKFTFSSKSAELNELPSAKRDDYVGYYFYCKPDTLDEAPHSLTLYQVQTSETVPLEVNINVYKQLVDIAVVKSNKTVICLKPNTTPGVQSSKTVEFLAYHQLLGVNNFIIYDHGLPLKLRVALQKAAEFDFSVTVVPWNLPIDLGHTEVAETVLQKDCLLRSSGIAENSVTISLDEYIVPRYHSAVSSLLKDFDKGNENKVARFVLPVLVFCTEYPDTMKHQQFLPFRKTVYNSALSRKDGLLIYRPRIVPRTAGSVQHISKNIAALHRYHQCDVSKAPDVPGQLNHNVANDTSILNLAKKLSASRFLRMWMLGAF